MQHISSTDHDSEYFFQLKAIVRNDRGDKKKYLTGDIKEICRYAMAKGRKVAGLTESENGIRCITSGHLYFRYGVEQNVIIS